MKKKSFLKKHWSSLLLLTLIVLLFVPQTAMPIKVFINKLFAFSPSEIAETKRARLQQYHWELLDSQGVPYNLSQSEGKVILINFWATWCPPCRAEMPSLQALFDTYGQEVDFYFVSQEDASTQLRFLDKKGYHLPIYTQIAYPPEYIGASSLPTTYLIDKDGSIVMKEVGAAKWDSETVRNLINQLLE